MVPSPWKRRLKDQGTLEERHSARTKRRKCRSYRNKKYKKNESNTHDVARSNATSSAGRNNSSSSNSYRLERPRNITHSRLSLSIRNDGLFKLGKTSNPVSRAVTAPVLSCEDQARADADLARIINLSRKDANPPLLLEAVKQAQQQSLLGAGDGPPTTNHRQTSSADRNNSPCQSDDPVDTVDGHKSDPDHRRRMKENLKTGPINLGIKYPSSSEYLTPCETVLKQSPPYSDILTDMSANLQNLTLRMFPEKDLFNNTREQLLKSRRQMSVSNEGCESVYSPLVKRTTISGSRTSRVVRRHAVENDATMSYQLDSNTENSSADTSGNRNTCRLIPATHESTTTSVVNVVTEPSTGSFRHHHAHSVDDAMAGVQIEDSRLHVDSIYPQQPDTVLINPYGESSQPVQYFNSLRPGFYQQHPYYVNNSSVPVPYPYPVFRRYQSYPPWQPFNQTGACRFFNAIPVPGYYGPVVVDDYTTQVTEEDIFETGPDPGRRHGDSAMVTKTTTCNICPPDSDDCDSGSPVWVPRFVTTTVREKPTIDTPSPLAKMEPNKMF